MFFNTLKQLLESSIYMQIMNMLIANLSLLVIKNRFPLGLLKAHCYSALSYCIYLTTHLKIFKIYVFLLIGLGLPHPCS